MKFSLRSLMIGVTLVCVLLGGRIEYLRRWALYHEHMDLVFSRPGFAASLHEYHDSRASLYRQAMWRPWTVIDESQAMTATGPSGPMRFARDLAWLTFLAALAVVWWIDRRNLVRRIESLELTYRQVTLTENQGNWPSPPSSVPSSTQMGDVG